MTVGTIALSGTTGGPTTRWLTARRRRDAVIVLACLVGHALFFAWLALDTVRPPAVRLYPGPPAIQVELFRTRQPPEVRTRRPRDPVALPIPLAPLSHVVPRPAPSPPVTATESAPEGGRARSDGTAASGLGVGARVLPAAAPPVVPRSWRGQCDLPPEPTPVSVAALDACRESLLARARPLGGNARQRALPDRRRQFERQGEANLRRYDDLRSPQTPGGANNQGAGSIGGNFGMGDIHDSIVTVVRRRGGETRWGPATPPPRP